MNSVRLFFVRANQTKFGGAEVYLSRLSSALHEKGIQHSVINSSFPKILPSWLRAIFFNIQLCLSKGSKLYFSLERITCPDIYRAGDGVHKVFLSVASKSRFNPLHPTYLFLEKRCFNRAKHIIANSNMVKNDIINSYGIRPEKISVVYNGVPDKENCFDRSFKKVSKEFSIERHHKILLYVGSGFKRKGVMEFLKIVSMLDNTDVRAFVVGKDKNLNSYQEAKKLSIGDKVFFTGPREDVDDFYSVSHIFILPTHYEPFSNTVLEAMSFENAVFTTKQNGASEVLPSDFIMSSPNDVSVVDKINHLFQFEDVLQREMQYNKKLSQELSIERNLSATLKVIDKVIDL